MSGNPKNPKLALGDSDLTAGRSLMSGISAG